MTNREFFLQRCSAEGTLFEQVFRAVPADKLDWRPEPKARTARELMGHLIGHEQDVVELLDRGDINHRMQVEFNNVDQAVELYRQAHQTIAAKLKSVDDKTWEGKLAKFQAGSQVIMEAPQGDLAWMLLFDSVHHRGSSARTCAPWAARYRRSMGRPQTPGRTERARS